MAYTPIAIGEIDTDSPVTQALMTKYRDNIDAVYEDTRYYFRKADALPEKQNSVAYENDSTITWAVGANELWSFEGALLVTTTAVADFKMQLVCDVAFTYGRIWSAFRQGAPGSFQDAGKDSPVQYALDVVSAPMFVKGFAEIAGAPGTIHLQYAQLNLENVSSCALAVNSHWTVHRYDAL